MTARSTFQQCRAICQDFWNLEPPSVPQPVANPDSGIKRLVPHLGSIVKGLPTGLTYLECNALIPGSIPPVTDTLAV